jgi:DNA polymerase III subunit delta
MVAVTARDAERFLAGAYTDFPVILFYGPDEGLVSERAAAIASATTGGDAGNILRLDGDEVAADPLRLADEANAISMFGGQRAIRVKAGARSIASALEPLLAAPPIDARVIVEAGDIKGNHALRALLEKAKGAAAVPCYAEDARDLGRLLDEMLTAEGLAIDPDARPMLLGLLGADRRLSRMEIEKLLLYCRGAGRVTASDVEAIVTDAAALSVDAVIDAAFLGRLDTIEQEARRLFADGQDAAALLGFALRQAFLLQAIRRDLNGKRIAPESIKPYRVNWKREKTIVAQAESWTETRLERAVQIIGDAVLAVRRQPTLAEALAIRALWSLALAARR